MVCKERFRRKFPCVQRTHIAGNDEDLVITHHMTFATLLFIHRFTESPKQYCQTRKLPTHLIIILNKRILNFFALCTAHFEFVVALHDDTICPHACYVL